MPVALERAEALEEDDKALSKEQQELLELDRDMLVEGWSFVSRHAIAAEYVAGSRVSIYAGKAASHEVATPGWLNEEG